MKKYIFIPTLLACVLISCTKEDITSVTTSSMQQNDVAVLQERSLSLPKNVKNSSVILESKKSRAINANGAIIGNSDALLGYSYTVGNSILGDYENVVSPVINIEKVKEYGADYVSSKALQYYSAEQFSYSDYNTYESKLSETKKISSGFSLNLGLFKLGRKKTTESTFKSETTSNNNAVYGELNLVYRNSAFTLQSSDGSRKFYARECLSPVFQKNLYSSTIGDILNTYGDYILTGYVTGGKAFALFAGIGNSGSSATSRENGMSKDINASFSWKNNSAGADCNFGNGNSSSTGSSYETRNLQTKLWIYGGNPVGLGMNNAVDLKNVNFDLTSWVNSLSDSKLHTIIDLTENGLYPLSAFILEENLKKRMDNTSSGILSKYPKFVTPYIEIVRVFERYSSSGQALYDIAAVLNTRQGDKIVLRSESASGATDAELLKNENSSVFNEKAAKILQQKQKFYDLKIISNSAMRLNPQMVGPILCIDLGKFDESAMFTFTNSRTGMQYIYDTKTKVAFSHFTDDLDGDWILDDYGIRNWVESLPVKSISMATIANSYRIIGL